MDARVLLLFCAFAVANVNSFVRRDVIPEIEENPAVADAPYGFIERVKYCYGETLSHTVNIVKKEHLQPLLSFFENSWNKIRRIDKDSPSNYERYEKERQPITWEAFQNDLKEFRNCFRQTVMEIVDEMTETKLQPLFRGVEEHLGKLTKVVDVLTAPKESPKPSQE